MPHRFIEGVLAVVGGVRAVSLLRDRKANRDLTDRADSDEESTPHDSHADEALREANARYRTTFTLAPVGIAHVDREHRLISVNDLFCRLVGYSSDELLGRPIEEIMHPDERVAAGRAIDDLMQGTLPRLQSERRYIRKDGAVVWTKVNVAAVPNGSDEVAYLIGVVEDITDKKAARERMRMQSRILECVDQAVIATDSQGNVSYWNAAAEDLFGWPEAEVLGKPARRFVSAASDDEIVEIDQRLRDSRGWSGEVLLQRRDQTTFPAFLTKAPIASDERSPGGSVAVVHDLTETKRVEHELRRHARQQEAMASLGNFALTAMDRHTFDIISEVLRFGAASDGVLIFELADGGAPTLKLLGADHPMPALSHDFPLLPDGECGVAIATGEPVIVTGTRTDRRFRAEPFVAESMISRAVVPIASATRTFGVLCAHSQEPSHFSDSDVHFLRTAANMLAEAMEREAAWNYIEESERRYASIFEGATEIIFTLDPQGRFMALNQAFETITGWRRDEYLGRHYAALISPSDRERVASLLDDLLSGRAQITEAEMTLVGREGPIDVEVSSFAKVDDGRVTEIYGFVRDVTQARREMEERERVTRNLELLLASTVEGIFTLDNEGHCTMINDAAARFVGATADALLGVDICSLVDRAGLSPSAASFSLGDMLSSSEPSVGTTEIYAAPNGRPVPVTYSAAPIFDEGTRVGTVVAFTDVSERRRLEAKLEQADRLASLGRLAATIAHEFNNVLMGIGPFVEVMRRKPTPEKISMSLDHIANAVQRGRRITEEILRFTQPAEPVLMPLDLAPWLDRFVREMRSILPAQYRVAADAQPVSIAADPNQLHQILLNLVLNARDAMPGGGPILLRARREPASAHFPFGTVRNPERYVHLEIEDTGAGMSAETLRHAFEPLFTTKRNGTGLGLAVTHQVVMRHHGEIFIQSAEGQGTTFHIFLPLANDSANASEHRDEGFADPSAPRILLVDDDPTVVAGLSSLLEFEGFSVVTALTGNDALRSVETSRPNAVVLDVGLPDLDGRDVFASIVARHPDLPVIFSTGHLDRSTLEDLLSRPHVGYLRKPYAAEELVRALRALMPPAVSG